VRVYEAKDIRRKYLSWLLYGKSRSGKTGLIGTFPPPICCTNFPNEDGIITMQGHSDVTVAHIETAKDMVDFPDWVFSQQAQRIAEGKKPFATVAVDSITSWIELLVKEHVALNGKIKIPTDLYLYDEWGMLIRTLIDRLRPLECEQVYTATASINKDELTGSTFGGPDMFKSLEKRVPAKVAATIYLEADTVTTEVAGIKRTLVKRVAHLAPWNGMTAGVRGCFLRAIKDPKAEGKFIVDETGSVENPTFAKIMQAISEPLFD
jgi:hypothetical protein